MPICVEIVEMFRRHRALMQEQAENKLLLRDEDPEMRELAQEDLRRIEAELPEVEQELKLMLLPKDPLDEKTPSLKFALAPAVKKRPCLPPTFPHVYALC